MILERAAAEGRVFLTYDRQTVHGFAYARMASGEAMPGIFLVDKTLPLGKAIDEILLAIHCSTPEECKDFVRYFPL